MAQRQGKITQIHGEFRQFLATNQGRQKTPKWGRFGRNARYNKDQVPLPFVVYLKDTYEEEGQQRCGFDKTKLAWTKGSAPWNCVSILVKTNLDLVLFLEL